MALDTPRRILVINVSRIGDTLLVTPAIRALAKAWPKSQITFLGHPKRVEVVENVPFLTKTGAITKHRALWSGWLWSKRWDLALVYGFDRPLVQYALRVSRKVVAFRQSDPSLNARLFRCVEPPAFQTVHAAQSPLLLTRALGLPDAGLRLAYAVTEKERMWAKATLAALLPRNARPLVGLQMASFPTKGYRDWPIERFLELGQRILAHWPRVHFLLFGGALERKRIHEFARRFPGSVADFSGRLRLRQSAALMNEVDLYIGVDTGPTHIMGALERPMIALYHCYSPSRYLKPLDRTGCYVVDHPRIQGCTPETSMAEISVDMVWQKVLEAMPAA